MSAWVAAAVVASTLFYAGLVAEQRRPEPFVETLAVQAVACRHR